MLFNYCNIPLCYHERTYQNTTTLSRRYRAKPSLDNSKCEHPKQDQPHYHPEEGRLVPCPNAGQANLHLSDI